MAVWGAISAVPGRATFGIGRRNERASLWLKRQGGFAMADDKTRALPDGTDTIIEGVERKDPATGTLSADTTLVAESEIPAPRGETERRVTGSGSPEGGLADRLREG